MKLSIVVATFNRADSLALTIDSVSSLTPSPHLDVELVVVDNNSRDHTRTVVEHAARNCRFPIRYVHERSQGSNSARNAGIAQSTGDVLAFIDDDNTLSSGWLAGVGRACADCSQASLLSGRIVPVFPGQNPGFIPDWIPDVWRATYGLQDYGAVPIELRAPVLPFEMNLIVPRTVFRECGVFGTAVQRSSRGLISNDGLDFVNRVRARHGVCMYHPAFLAHHHIPGARATPGYLLSRAFWQGVSDARCDPIVAASSRTKLAKAAFRHAWRLVRDASRDYLSPRRTRRHLGAGDLERRCLMAHRRGLMMEYFGIAFARRRGGTESATDAVSVSG
jgi:glycosyltransferase involved in cell wall biosynthesis